jgi:hypothetical protein
VIKDFLRGVLRAVPPLILLLSCTPFPEFKRIEEGNFNNIFYGRYPFKTWALKEKDKEIELLEREFLKREGIFKEISEELTGLKVKKFRFLYAAHDRVNKKKVVRFFGDLVKRHPVFAGVSVEIVLNGRGRIEAVYIKEIPYE